MKEESVFEGKNLKTVIYGSSHAEKIGLILSGFPAGVKYDELFVTRLLERRAPGGAYASQRKEKDLPVILSGFTNGVSDGSPIRMEIANEDVRRTDYPENMPVRPGHADYPALVKYGKDVDLSGGGHFSGRMTAPLVFAGALCMLHQRQSGILYTSHLLKVGKAEDRRFEDEDLTSGAIKSRESADFPTLEKDAAEKMKAELLSASECGDSIGGTVECAVIGLPVGIGSHMARGVEGTVSSFLFAIPAVKGVEFGDGFALSSMRGSESNDGYTVENGKVKMLSNHCGGILGGMTCGTPLMFRAVFKPTPSIALIQRSVDRSLLVETPVAVKGRHDPCVALRGTVAAEAAAALAIEELMLDDIG